MSLRITCPTCGTRSVHEFHYGEIPDPPKGLDRAGLAYERAFIKTNPDGPAQEAWFHAAGCRRWVHILRDRSAP